MADDTERRRLPGSLLVLAARWLRRGALRVAERLAQFEAQAAPPARAAAPPPAPPLVEPPTSAPPREEGTPTPTSATLSTEGSPGATMDTAGATPQVAPAQATVSPPPQSLTVSQAPQSLTRDVPAVAQETGASKRAPRGEPELLREELAALSASRCTNRQFIAWASELAARARLLQEEPGEFNVAAPLVRRLTAIVAERKAGFVYGLAKHHQGDWAALAEEARSTRAFVDAPGSSSEPKSLTHKLPLGQQHRAEGPSGDKRIGALGKRGPSALSAGLKTPKRAPIAPELLAELEASKHAARPPEASAKALTGRPPSPPEATEGKSTVPAQPKSQAPVKAAKGSPAARQSNVAAQGAEPQAFPALHQASRQHPIVIAGGTIKHAKLKALQQRGLQVEWVSTEKNHQPIASLVQRMTQGHVCALILLQGLVKHRQSGHLVEAAKRANIPMAYGDRAGGASIERALGHLEQVLSAHA